MAYSCVQVLFEIGHEATIRTKATPQGFTHDWEVFVRGADNTEINHFVDKVVFHLHETFPKPKRVVKEPPYSVKESGYAAFNLPIDICFRTDEEPKKVRFNYDLDLQPVKVQREKYVFRNPDEDLRRRLICGGGVGVGSDSSISGHLTPVEKPSSSPAVVAASDEVCTAKPPASLLGKLKLGVETTKKHKIKEYRSEEPRASSSFHELFGTPIKTTKASPDPKKSSSSPKVSPLPKSVKPPDKPNSDKQVSGSKPVKHSAPKDSREGIGKSSKEEKKDHTKDHDKNKEKSKHPTTSPKRPPTPPKFPSASKPMKEEPKKVQIEESKGKSDLKSLSDSGKSDKKRKDKKSKDEKSKKERHKDHESKSSEKVDKIEKSAKESKDKDKETARKPEKDSNRESEKPKEREKLNSDGDKERAKHKHKKKERSKRVENGKERDRDKEKGVKKGSSDNKKTGETNDRDRNGVTSDANKKCSRSRSHSPLHSVSSPAKPTSSPQKPVHTSVVKDKPAKRPLNKLFDELKNHESSDSNLSPDEDSIELPTPQLSKVSAPVENSGSLEIAVKHDVSNKSLTNSGPEATRSRPESLNQERNSLMKVSSVKQKDKSASKRGKEKKEPSGSGGNSEGVRRGGKDISKKRKHKSSGKDQEEEEEEEASGVGRENGAAPPKLSKLDPDLSITDDPVEWVPTEVEVQAEVSTTTADEVQNAAAVPEKFSPDYVLQLRDLQRKIMTLEDNAELQRVVQVIAETGQYEITKKTFDFDLCALDRSTVKRLQDFFTNS